MDSRDTPLLDKMTESAGEVLFEASAHEEDYDARVMIKALAHHLGRLYGETIRACRGYDGLKEEVTTTFMCGMALEPNFGREEENGEAKALNEARERVIKRGTAPLMTAEEMEEAYRAKKEGNRPKACEKCTGTGNMSLLGEYEKCDACE